jgi:hypothetical protein
MSSLNFRMEAAEDGTGELFLIVDYQGFSGSSSCYVDLISFREVAQKFALYPIPADRSVRLEGGYFAPDMKSLVQTHLHISAVPIDSVGNVGLSVSLAVPNDEGISTYKASLNCEFSVSYEQLKDLSRGLIALAERQRDEYSLAL